VHADDIPIEARIAPFDYMDSIRLLGYKTDRDDVQPDQSMGLTLYWQCLGPIEENYNLSVKFLGRQGEIIGEVDSYPGWGTYPTSLWSVGEVIKDNYSVPITPTARVPSQVIIDVGLYLPEDKVRLPVRNVAGEETQSILGSFRLAPNEPIVYNIHTPTRFQLGGKVTLEGYDLEQNQVAVGSEVGLTLYWRANQHLSEDYTVFVHLVDDHDYIWCQHDKPPLSGDYPTSFWHEDEVIKDEHLLQLEEDMPTGRYWIEVGMYLLNDGERLPLVDDSGQVLDSRILLVPITVSK